MFQVVCAHTRVWGCGAMLAHAVRPPHYTEPHHTVLHPSHPTAPHPAGKPCWQGGPRSSWLPLFSFPAVGPAVGGHCVVLNVNPALPWARGQLAAILLGSKEGLGARSCWGSLGSGRPACCSSPLSPTGTALLGAVSGEYLMGFLSVLKIQPGVM